MTWECLWSKSTHSTSHQKDAVAQEWMTETLNHHTCTSVNLHDNNYYEGRWLWYVLYQCTTQYIKYASLLVTAEPLLVCVKTGTLLNKYCTDNRPRGKMIGMDLHCIEYTSQLLYTHSHSTCITTCSLQLPSLYSMGFRLVKIVEHKPLKQSLLRQLYKYCTLYS